jgi:hypothetical protein
MIKESFFLLSEKKIPFYFKFHFLSLANTDPNENQMDMLEFSYQFVDCLNRHIQDCEAVLSQMPITPEWQSLFNKI